MDRTEYKQRGQWVQILMIGVAYKGMSIALLWHTANRKGNCSQLASRDLLSNFQKWIQLDKGQNIYLTADWEFIGMHI
ncbi:hypothetical protein [Xanthocytophaga agilis]|uniref:Transposase n=1 Tax=Xanthocytophaga agilis TaxID=3048010 RepID=A0AAE3UK81_9BACT|nr:hypothetical protein [Xanthocytophaga agilis]MDJ1506628.1 hypothetical protein [Xanthocytophaga agilis]